MKSYAKGKFILFISSVLVVALIVLIGFQLVNIAKTKSQVAKEQTQIEALEREKNYFDNQTSDGFSIDQNVNVED